MSDARRSDGRRPAGAQDVADARAAARHGLLRPRGGRGVRAPRHRRAGPGTSRPGRRRWAPWPPDVVVSTFFNFNPELVHARDPRRRGRWRHPTQLVAARFAAVDAAFRRLLGDECRRVRRDAPRRGPGPHGGGGRRRGGWRAVRWRRRTPTWPGRPSHTCSCGTRSRSCREFRGDGHVALLVVHGLSGIESLVTHAAAGDVPGPCAALDAGLVRGRVGRSGRTRCGGGAGSQTSDELRFTEWGAAQRRDDRGRHRRAGRGALRRPGRRGMRRAARPGAAVEHELSPSSCRAEGSVTGRRRGWA